MLKSNAMEMNVLASNAFKLDQHMRAGHHSHH